MSSFPGSPRLLKGALAIFETVAPLPTNLIAFQYNPDSVSRTFEAQTGYDGGDPRRIAGDTQNALSPTERIRMSVELDAADQLEQAADVAVSTGLHPTLSALELLMYPGSTQVLLGKVLSAIGSAYVAPARVPTVLLVWGPLRVVPIRVESIAITEEAFDQKLNPIRAKVDLEVRTLTSKELKAAGAVFEVLDIVNLIAKEGLARLNSGATYEQIIGSAAFTIGRAI
jgi:Contractile injection system tube protein